VYCNFTMCENKWWWWWWWWCYTYTFRSHWDHNILDWVPWAMANLGHPYTRSWLQYYLPTHDVFLQLLLLFIAFPGTKPTKIHHPICHRQTLNATGFMQDPTARTLRELTRVRRAPPDDRLLNENYFIQITTVICHSSATEPTRQKYGRKMSDKNGHKAAATMRERDRQDRQTDRTTQNTTFVIVYNK